MFYWDDGKGPFHVGTHLLPLGASLGRALLRLGTFIFHFSIPEMSRTATRRYSVDVHV